MLGGRAAEETVYGSKTTGAESDIEQATNLARTMVTRWGMSDAVGLVQLAPRSQSYLGEGGGYAGQRPFSEATAQLVDRETQRIIGECHEQAKDLLVRHRKTLDALAAALLEHETLDEEEILRVTGLRPAPPILTGRLAVAGQDAGSGSPEASGAPAIH
jgi:cell division protease FtsH